MTIECHKFTLINNRNLFSILGARNTLGNKNNCCKIGAMKTSEFLYKYNNKEIPVHVSRAHQRNIYYRFKEDGFYVFQTTTTSKGKPLLFSKNEKDIGNFDDAVVLCIKEFTDRFYYDLLE